MINTKKMASAFSLIEIMIAVAIMGIMFALVGPSALKYFGKAKTSLTKTNLSSVKSALLEYQNDIGHFPNKTEGALGGLGALVKMPKGDKMKERWNGPYVDGDELPQDGWKNDFHYATPPAKYKQYKNFELYSDGENNDSDVKNDLHVGA
ncbi:MAG: ral secretion pathway protein [Candidatus Dependentiae bacterium]|nr:ral secretion pathway protein [Candidatus Dependentiae bacterium]